MKIIDFGLAKQTRDFTYSIIGTSHYMSPEVILGKGYSKQCDYWSAGVILYILYYNDYPFGSGLTNTIYIYNSILNSSLVFPIHKEVYLKKSNFDFTREIPFEINNNIDVCNEIDINNILSQSLDKNQRTRVSSISDISSIIKNININDIMDMKDQQVPYLPKFTLHPNSLFNPEDQIYFKDNKTIIKEAVLLENNSASLLKGVLYDKSWFTTNLHYSNTSITTNKKRLLSQNVLNK